MRFDNTSVTGIDTAIRSMRMPLQSFDKSDSYWDKDYNDYVDLDGAFHIGLKDLDLAHRLLSTGSDSDGKFLRSIHVYTEITAPVYWLQELDTYKISTVRNSSSLQHTGAKRDYKASDFAQDPVNMSPLTDKQKELVERNDNLWKAWIENINDLRQEYKNTNDYMWFRLMRQNMPQSYLYTISWTANYAVLRNIWRQRVKKPHRLAEWRELGQWIQTLPYSRDLIMWEDNNND